MLFLWVFVFVFVFVLVFSYSIIQAFFALHSEIRGICSKCVQSSIWNQYTKWVKLHTSSLPTVSSGCASTPAPGLLLHPRLRQSGDLGCGSKLQNPHFVPTPSMGSKAFIPISANVASHTLLVLWREACVWCLPPHLSIVTYQKIGIYIFSC